ncbi:hypothetical protein [Streptomyces sp. BA2]|uniref:hypothetical protein n=1 Tax=Streptomyces sp. BA2 TaxID=436595 RepID=UPI001328C308|nr:hypothetical protein [Streptomyces sp. BA2]MWA12758.1 hypothetical protein [Streptomyces sp. BA2]
MAKREPNALPPQFMDLEVPEYAYMFGFLQADGHLSQEAGQKGRLSVEINVRDISILREFQRLTPYNSTISERTRATNFAENHHSAMWSLYSLEARTKLNQLGLPYGRKSKTITPPRVEFSRRDYLRGVIDADGAVGYCKDGSPYISLTTASTAVGVYLCRYVRQLTGIQRFIKRNTRDKIYNIPFTRETAQALGTDLYYPGCLALERKQAAVDSFTSWERPAGMRAVSGRRLWKEWEDRILLQLSNDATAAKELGRTEKSCHLRLWRLHTGQVPMPSGR